MPDKPSSPADQIEEQSDSLQPGDPNVELPSVEEVVARLERICPAAISRLKSPDLAGQTLGRYTLQKVVGRGAFGVVYHARDDQLERDVAIKVPRPEVLFDEGKLRRFESEAATAATLDHPSIIPLYEADLAGPMPYIASAYCAGPNLGTWLTNRSEPVPVEQATQFVIKLAEAVYYAHRQGVLHRDLKPSNIMLEPLSKTGSSGQLEHFEPRLTDFGLAKLLEGSQHDTQSSLMLGTPLYMAPEQVDHQIGEVGVPTDVYALGSILYELLVGKPAFDGKSHVELLLAIREREVTPPTRFRASVPSTLEAVCLKALEKSPASRYATARELAEDLGRYLRGEPTMAKPLAFPSRVMKWIRLNPWAASLLAVVSVSIVGLLLGVLWHNRLLSDQLNVSNRLRVKSIESAKRSLRARYVADIQLAQQAIADGRFSGARAHLDRYLSKKGKDIRDFAWHLLSGQLEQTTMRFDSPEPATALAISDEIGVSVTGGKDGVLRFFDATTGSQIAATQSHKGDVNAIVFANGGTTLITGGDDGVLAAWDTSSLLASGKLKLLAKRNAHSDDLLCLAISPDAKQIASGGSDNQLHLWNFDDLLPAGKLVGHTDWIRALDFSPDGQFLASGSDDATVRRWDLESLTEVGRFEGHEKYVLSVRHHPTEPLLVSGGKDKILRFWDLSTNEEQQQLLALNGWVRALAFSQDGSTLAAAADEPRVLLFEPSSEGRYEQTKVAFTDHTNNYGVAFTNSDRQVVVAGSLGASAWSFNSPIASDKLGEAAGGFFQLVGSPKNNEFVLVTSLGIVDLNSQTGEIREFSLENDETVVSSDANSIVFRTFEEIEERVISRIHVCDGKGENQRLLFAGQGACSGIAISPSGKMIAAGTPDRLIRIWHAPDFQQVALVRNPRDSIYLNLAIDDAGKRLLLIPYNSHELVILDVATSKVVSDFQNVERIAGRSTEGRLLAISRSDYSVTIYDINRDQVALELPSHSNDVVGACFSPVEEIVATVTRDGEIVLWALDTRDMLIRFQAGFAGTTYGDIHLAFASDGRTLLAAGDVFNAAHQRVTELRTWRVP